MVKGRVGTVLDLGGAAQDAGLGIGLILQRDVDLARDILHHNAELVAVDLMRNILEREVAIAVGEGDLEVGLDVETTAPTDELMRSCGDGRIEGRSFGHGFGRGKAVTGPKALAPIEGLQLLVLVDAENVSGVRGVDAKDAGGRVEVNRGRDSLRSCRRSVEAGKTNQQCECTELCKAVSCASAE